MLSQSEISLLHRTLSSSVTLVVLPESAEDHRANSISPDVLLQPVTGGPLPNDFLAADFFRREPLCCLSSQGDRLYLTTVYQRDVFIRVFNIGSQEVEQAVALRAPEQMFGCRVQHDGDTLCIVSLTGAVLELSTTTWNLLSWYPARVKIRGPDLLGSAWLVPKTRFLWMGYQPKKGEHLRIRVLDLAHNRVHRDLASAVLAGLLLCEHLPQVLVSEVLHSRLYPANGSHPSLLPLGIRSVAQRPDGAGVLALWVSHQEIQLGLIQPDLPCANQHTVKGALDDSRYVLASSRQSQHAYLLFNDRDHLHWLAAFQVENEVLVERFRLQVPFGTALAQDVSGRGVALIAPMGRNARVLLLGSEPPNLEACFQDRRLPKVPRRHLLFSCGRREEDKIWHEEARKAVAQRSQIAAKRFVEKFVRAHQQDSDALLAFAHALFLEDQYDLVDVTQFFHEKHSQLASTRLYTTELLIGLEQWPQALQRLGSEASFTGRRLCHFHHLRGVALFKLGQYAEALQEFSAAKAVVEGNCEVEPWAEMTSALLRGGRPESEQKETLSDQYVRRLVLADEHLAGGEGAKAFEALDCALIWSARDLQMLARLAQAMLIQSDEAGFLKPLALACYLRVFEQQYGEGELQVPHAHLAWDDARLKEVADRANQWLARRQRQDSAANSTARR